jgi:hypothetical protein
LVEAVQAQLLGATTLNVRVSPYGDARALAGVTVMEHGGVVSEILVMKTPEVPDGNVDDVTGKPDPPV